MKRLLNKIKYRIIVSFLRIIPIKFILKRFPDLSGHQQHTIIKHLIITESKWSRQLVFSDSSAIRDDLANKNMHLDILLTDASLYIKYVVSENNYGHDRLMWDYTQTVRESTMRIFLKYGLSL